MANGKSVLLVMPSFNGYLFGKDWVYNESLSSPLGLLYLASPLIKAGYNVKLVDLNVDNLEKKDFVKMLKGNDFILLSCYTVNLECTKEVIKEARRVNKKAFILVGGPHCNINNEYVKGSDVTAVGEAENFIVSIIDALRSKSSLDAIPGLFYKKKGKIVRTEGVMAVDNLDDSLPPALELAEGKKYGYLNGIKLNIAPIMSSRGCPFRCRYCTFKTRAAYQTRSVGSVVEELKRLKSKGYEYVFFGDDNLLLNKKRVMELMDRIIEEKLNLRMIMQGRVDSADAELYKKLREAGTALIMFGIESVNQDVLNFYRKGITLKQIENAVRLANNNNIISFGYFMFGSPLETEEHIRRTKEFFDKTPLDIMIMSVLSYYRGSELWEEAASKGLISKSSFWVSSNEKLSHYSFKELRGIVDDLTKYFYSPKRILKLVYKFVKVGAAPIVLKGLLSGSFSRLVNFTKHPFIDFKETYSN